MILALAASGCTLTMSQAHAAEDAVPQAQQEESPAAVARTQLNTLADAAERELLGNILPFWMRHAPAQGPLAFQGQVGADLKPVQGAERGMLLSARILWTFSAAHRLYPDKGYLALADDAYRDLETRFWDVRNGGYIWSVSAEASPRDTRKQVYGQSFAIYGLAEYAQATGRREPLDRALQLFHLLEKHSRDARDGGYIEAFTADWQRPKGEAMSVIGPDFAKSQNTHLHLMEAFANLLRAAPQEPLVRTRLREVTELMITRIPTPDGRHLQLYFDADWTPRSELISYGHDIEANWLLCDAADTLGDATFTTRVRRQALLLARATLAEGMDKDGGVWNEGGPAGLLNAGKDWWSQAEAAVGFLNAYQLTEDPVMLEATQKVWTFTKARVVDTRDGEWFYGTAPSGETITTAPKISMWKCPYHNARACMELVRRARVR